MGRTPAARAGITVADNVCEESPAAVPADRPKRLPVCCTLKPEAQISPPARAPRPNSDVRSTKDLDRRPLHFDVDLDVSLRGAEVLVAGELHDDLG